MRTEDFFRDGDYWSVWSAVPEATADIGYALTAVGRHDSRILDVPCGHGRLLHAVTRRAPKAALFGVDVNESTFRIASLTSCWHESFMHVDRPLVAIQELARVCRERLYLSVTTRRQLNTLLLFIYGSRET
jgi:2-polyprenyl-3-methyl-5-hydroxy-6-metoxy-1,4-benzoquinol methylase